MKFRKELPIVEAAVDMPRVDITPGDVLDGLADIALEHHISVLVGLGLAGVALAASAEVAAASNTVNGLAEKIIEFVPSRQEFVDSAVMVIDAVKWPLLVGAGGAYRIHERRKSEFISIEANLKQLEERQRGMPGRGIFSQRGNDDVEKQRAQIEATVAYFTQQRKLYEDKGLKGWFSKELWREFGEGVFLGVSFDAFPQIYLFLTTQLDAATALLNVQGESNIAAVEGGKRLIATLALMVFYGGVIRKFLKIQSPGGKRGSEEDSTARSQKS